MTRNLLIRNCHKKERISDAYKIACRYAKDLSNDGNRLKELFNRERTLAGYGVEKDAWREVISWLSDFKESKRTYWKVTYSSTNATAYFRNKKDAYEWFCKCYAANNPEKVIVYGRQKQKEIESTI